MAKIQSIERCIQCGARMKPLIPSNYKDLIRVENIVNDFNRECATKNLKNPCLCFTSAYSASDSNSDMFYFLCSVCCRKLIQDFLSYSIRVHRDILFQKFDKIREELKQ